LDEPRSEPYANSRAQCRQSTGYLLPVTSQEAIREVRERLAVAFDGPARVLVFGSAARPDAVDVNDLDLLVIEPKFTDRWAERRRLRKALSGLVIPIDLIVITEAEAERWGGVPGTALHDALREGRVLVDT
jgi:predicted nucleotidyltransferase